MFSNAYRYYSQFASVEPRLIEALLVPFHVGGTAVGTVWVVAHDESRQFDAEDQRVLESLGKFAATAYQVRLTIADHAKTNKELQAEVAERQRVEQALRESEERLRQQAQELEHQLIASGRLVSLGEVSASMAHEFNNLLGIIMGFVEDMLSSAEKTTAEEFRWKASREQEVLLRFICRWNEHLSAKRTPRNPNGTQGNCQGFA
jgi:C4-dicarboxylate-specific signal transduction histidine kinase